jgi:hypothetical protein
MCNSRPAWARDDEVFLLKVSTAALRATAIEARTEVA